MSFYSFKKPQLIENKLLKYYNNKYTTPKIKFSTLDSPDIINKNDGFKFEFLNKYYDEFFNIIKNNYGFFLIFFLLIILLYLRYIEVNMKKDKLKKIIDKDIY